MSVWFTLAWAILFEVCGTTALKLSDGFTKTVPTVLALVLYIIGLYLMTLVLKKLDLGLVYAIWSGMGTALVAIIGIAVFGDSVDMIRIGSIALIIIGVVGLHMGTQGIT